MKERADFDAWYGELRALCDAVRTGTRAALLAARDGGPGVTRPVARGAGDWTYGLDVPGEEWIAAWHERTARESPLSVLTEDSGWRHLGPGGGGAVPLEGFDHGGPRIAFDPVDGTRNLMADLRSAWTVVSFAAPGPGPPRLDDLTGGIVAEIPTTSARNYRVLSAAVGGPCLLEERALEDGVLLGERTVVADEDDRPDHGYLPFFRYQPAQRPHLARLEAAFFARLEEHEGADLRSVYDDQYISSAGQLVCLALGTYRMIVDARNLVARRAARSTVTSKPYDLAGAVLCARAAGAVVTAADGSALDFPLDTETAVDMAGYANERTRARLEPHWLAVLAER